MMGISTIQSIAQSAVGRLITGMAAGLLLAALAAILLRACRNAGTRFAIWLLTLVTIAVLPLAACFVSGRGTDLSSTYHMVLPSRWALGFFYLWLVGAGIGLSRVVVGLGRVWRIRRRCTDLETSGLREANPDLVRTLAEFSGTRRVSLCISEDVSVPTATGFFQPAVLLPAWATTELSAIELKSILLHELGHLQRWDDWTNLAQKILRALLFFHPAAWWIDSRLALEREIACDDFVVAKTSDPQGYARCLVSVAEKSVGRRTFAIAVAAVSRVHETAARLTRILDRHRAPRAGVSKPALASFAVLTFALVVELPRIPTIVVFRDVAPAQATLTHDIPPAAGDHAKPVPEMVPTSAREESVSREGLSQPMLRKAELRTRRPLSSGHRESTNRTRMNRVHADRNSRRSPMLVEAKWNEETWAPALLLLAQVIDCDGSGNCVVTVSAWQVSTIQQAKASQTRIGIQWKAI